MKIRKNKKIFFLWVYLYTSICISQVAYNEEQIRFYQGLPSDIVFRSFNDKNGFLYVSTQKGLVKYDGYRFVSSPFLMSRLSSVIYSEKQFIFHGNFFGIARLNKFLDQPVEYIKNNFSDSNPNNDHFENLYIDKKNRIWCSDFNNIKYFSEDFKSQKSFLIFPENKNIDSNIVFAEPVSGQVWIFCSKGLWVWDESRNKISKHQDLKTDLPFLNALQLNEQEFIFSLYNGQVGVYNFKTQKITFFQNNPGDETFLGFVKINEDEVLGYSNQKIYKISNGIFELVYKSERSQINHLNFDPETEIFWISTNKGLIKLTPIRAIQSYIFPEKEGKIITKSVAIEEDERGNIWVLNSKNEIWVLDTNQVWDQIQIKNPPSFSSINYIKDQIFIGSDEGLFEVRNKKLQKIPLIDLPQKQKIKKCLLTSSGELWLLYASIPIQRYDFDSLEKIKKTFQNPESFWTENAWNDMILDKNDKIWIGGWMPKSYGIAHFDAYKNQFIDNASLEVNKDRSKYFGDYVNRIALTQTHDLLFSGYGGFVYLNKEGNVYKKVDVIDFPIANGRIEGIAETTEGNIVFATGDGLHVYSKKNDNIVRISQIDGLPTDELIYGFKKLKNEKFALGIENGIVKVDADELLRVRISKKMAISSIIVNGKLRTSLENEIVLNKDETDLTIKFSDLSFTDHQKTYYRYKFKNENHWSDLGHNAEITFNRLNPGNYNLIIQTGNHSKQWKKETLDITIIVQPPFYKSKGFLFLIGVLLLILIFVMNRYLLLRQKKESAYRQKIKESEMQTLRAQMNPHFMFNTLNSINSYIIENKTETASEYLTKFSKLMRNILEYSKEEMIPLYKELQALKLYIELESARLENSFDYTFIIDKELKSNELIKVPPLILQPFVENAIWHGLNHKLESGNLIIAAQVVGNRLSIKIEDDGIGRKAAKEIKHKQTNHKSFGIEITRQRIEMLYEENSVEIVDLFNTEGIALGTQVIITLKIEP